MRKYLNKYFLINKFIIFICCTAYFFSLFSTVNYTVYAENNKETVRVGVFHLDGFYEYDSFGNLTGYNAEYLNRISGLTGWKYEYVDVGDFLNGMTMLESKEIDLLAPCQMTDERREKFDFCSYSFGTEYVALVASGNGKEYAFEDYESYNGIKVAAAKDYLITECFLEFIKDKNIDIDITYYNTPDDALEAVDNGLADAAVVNLMMVENTYQVLVKLTPAAFYYMTWKGNSKLLSDLDNAMISIKNNYPTLENDMVKTYFPIYNEQYLNAQEMEFVRTLDEITVGYVDNRAPISFTGSNGEFAGMTRDILDKVQAYSGIKFKYVKLPSGNVDMDYLRNNNITLTSGVEYNSTNINTTSMRMSNPYIYMKKVMVAKKELDFNTTSELNLGIVTGSMTIKNVIKSKYMNFNIIDYDNTRSCFKAVKSGETDMLILNQYIAEQWLAKPEYENMSIIPVEGLDDAQCQAVILSKDASNEELDISDKIINIINKSISRISQQDIDSIIVKESMHNRYSYTFMDFVYKYRHALIILILFFLIMVSMLVIVMIQRNKNIRKVQYEQSRYKYIMEKSDDIIYEYNLETNEFMVSSKMKNIFGWTFPDKVVFDSYESLCQLWMVCEEDNNILIEYVQKIISNKISNECTVRIKKGKDYIWCKVARYPIMDSAGKIISIVGKIVDVDSDVKEKKKLEKQTNTDELTNLLNLKSFTENVEKLMAAEECRCNCFVFIDLDYFKRINDTLGHMVGDKAIKEAADKLDDIFSDYGFTSRFGGDEFCVFMSGKTLDKIYSLLAAAVYSLRASYSDGYNTVNVSASIGAVYCIDKSISFDMMLYQSDRALYEAKEKGRDQYVFKAYGELAQNEMAKYQ